MHTLRVLQTCDVGREPAAGLFCRETFGDVFSRDQDLQRRGERACLKKKGTEGQTFATCWKSIATVRTNHINHTTRLLCRLTACEVSSGSRILMASGLFSEQYLDKKRGNKQHLMTCQQREPIEDKDGVMNTSWRLYLVALARASKPVTHSCAQMESFSLDGFGFGDSSPSRSIFSPRSTSSLTNVALAGRGKWKKRRKKRIKF